MHTAIPTERSLLQAGEELSSLLLGAMAIHSPVTRSALVIFEDSLEDDTDIGEVAQHLEWLREELGDMVPLSMKQALKGMAERLRELPETHQAKMFRSGFLLHRGITPA